jgi:hypothetical protein
LGHIAGRVIIPQHAKNNPIHWVIVAVKESLKGSGVVETCPCEEVTIRITW